MILIFILNFIILILIEAIGVRLHLWDLKKKMLQYFPICEFISGVRGITIENLWREFYQLYEILRKLFHTEEEILKFEDDAKNWIRTFCQPTIG